MKYSDEVLANYLTSENINLKFTPSRVAHCDWLWEAEIKSLKFHFKNVVDNLKLTFEELLTIN